MNWLINFLLHRGNDLSTYFLPNAYFFKSYILEHWSIPLWNPIQFTGIPYLADPQNYIFYFPNYLFVFLPVETAFLILLLAHFVWAGIGVYKLGRTHFHLNSLIAIFASLLFVLTPKFMAHLEAGHYAMVIAFSWLPWFMHLAFKFVAKPSLKLVCFLSLVSWILYVNYINIIYFSLLFYFSLALFKLLTRGLRVKSFLIHNSLFIILFVVLISPVLIPQLKFASQSTRNSITYSDVAQPIWSFKLFFQNLFFPFSLDHQQLSTERVLFPGITVWFLAAIGWLKYRATRSLGEGWFYLTWLIFSLLFALGDRIPFFIFFYKFFPLINWLRITTRLWIITLLFLAIFAGLGLKNLSRRHLLIFVCFLELIYVNFKIFSKPIANDPTPASFYELISQDTHKPFRVYCTTGCFSLQKLGELGIWSLSGNNPIQSAQFASDLQAAAGYAYTLYSPVLPPYQVFELQPQPNAGLMAKLDTRYIASPYALTDPDFKLLAQENGYFLYQVE